MNKNCKISVGLVWVELAGVCALYTSKMGDLLLGVDFIGSVVSLGLLKWSYGVGPTLDFTVGNTTSRSGVSCMVSIEYWVNWVVLGLSSIDNRASTALSSASCILNWFALGADTILGIARSRAAINNDSLVLAASGRRDFFQPLLIP